jgi:hypothetical protein
MFLGVRNSQDISDLFARYFQGVYVNDVSVRNADRYVFGEGLDGPAILSLILFTECDVEDALMNLDEFISRFLGRFFLGVKADFHGLEVDRPFITVVSRLMSNHTRVKANLNRKTIVTKAVCGCGKDYWTVYHILWSCYLYQAERMQLKSQLSGEDLSLCTRQ